MSVLDTPELVPVPVNYCPCAGTPHPDGDIVYMHPELSMPGGMAAQGVAQSAISDDGNVDYIALNEALARVWLLHGVAGWTFLDDAGKPIPITAENVLRALPFAKGGSLVSEKADELYGKAVLAPFEKRLEQLQTLSLPGSTPSSRSATSPNRASRRKQRSPSSTPGTGRARLDA